MSDIRDTSAVADVVVAGAGHNSLVAAAYLARVAQRCRVLDVRPVPGGGVASEELLLPGFKLDSCSTGHTLIQTNPLLAADELGLLAERRLRYIEPDPVAHVVFPDGDRMTMWLDIDDKILARLAISPVDLERSKAHMWHGTFHGDDPSLAYSGPQRPADGWAQHRMPTPGLYQTGGTTHPGGSVTGGPGRSAAIGMLRDLGRDPSEVMPALAELVPAG